MEYASTENLSTIDKGGKCKYRKRKYKSAWVENVSTEMGRAFDVIPARCDSYFRQQHHYYKFSPDSDSEMILKIGKFLVKLRHTKMVPFLFFGPPCR